MKTKKELLKEAFSLDLSGYTTAHIERTKDIIVDLIAGAPTLSKLTPAATGIKAGTTVQVPVMTDTVLFVTSDCPTSGTGSTTLSPRAFSPVRLTNREIWCPDSLDAKLPMLQTAGAKNESLTFEDLVIEYKVKESTRQLEKMAWRANTSTGSGNLALTNGYLKIADGETGSLAGYATFSSFTSGNAISTLTTALTNRSESMYEYESDVVIFLSNAYYDILADAFLNTYGNAGTGMYLNDGQENQLGMREMKWPNKSIRIRATHGLDSNNSIFITPESNLKYVTDLEADRESVDVFYDKFNRSVVSDLIFTIGFNYMIPGNVIYWKKV